jgi:hypothetical protein
VRVLHRRYAGNGSAAYHALRLISNCCADNDPNKRVVLECGGIELLLRCANLKIWPEVVIVALWNICAESDAQEDSQEETLSQDKEPVTQMYTIACRQLSLISSAECDDSNGKSVLTAELEGVGRRKGIINELMDLGDLMEDDTRKEMVAELFEKASWHSESHKLWRIRWLILTVSSDKAERIPVGSRLRRPDESSDYLRSLLTGSGRNLALTNAECLRDLTRSIAILIGNFDVQQEVIKQDLVKPFLEVLNWNSPDVEAHFAAADYLSKTLANVRQSLLKTMYDLSAEPEFGARYGEGPSCPQLVSECIAALEDLSSLTQRTETSIQKAIPAASACVILANLTKSVNYAQFLVRRKVHLSLALILRQRSDFETLFPAAALLDRLTIPPENKIAMFEAGVLYEIPRLLIGCDLQPRTQQGAISALRNIIRAQPEHASSIGVCTPATQEARPPEESSLLAALNLFRRTTDEENKLEIGRLFVEMCRTFFQSTMRRPQGTEDPIRLAFGNVTDIIDPITHLACNDTAPALRGEGWLGMALLSTWEYGRSRIVESLAKEDLQKKLEEILRDGDQACLQNISLMLTKFREFPNPKIPETTREVLKKACDLAGIPTDMPIVPPAA